MCCIILFIYLFCVLCLLIVGLNYTRMTYEMKFGSKYSVRVSGSGSGGDNLREI